MPKSFSIQKRREWTERLRLQHLSKLTVKQWCQENNLSTSVFYYWKGLLQPTLLKRSSFTELPSENKSAIILEYHTLRIYLENDFDADALRRTLHVLKEGLC